MDDQKPKVIRWYPSLRQRAEQYAATADQLQQERAEAASAVDRILRETKRDELPLLVERPELQSAGALDRLAAILSEELNRDPQYAEALAMLAVSLTETLPVTYHRVILVQTRATAWKDLGKVRSFLARHDEAIAAFDRAEAEIGDESLEHDRAIIRLNRAITYQETGRFDEALSLLTECREVFRDHAETALATICSFYEGLLLQRMHRYREARESHLLLLASGLVGDGETLAALYNDIGYCSIELRDFEAADFNLRRGIALYLELDQPIQALKGELGLGRLQIRRGRYADGLAILRKIRHQFLKSSLAEEAGICGLEMVEGLLFEKDFEAAEHLARTIMSEFLAADLNTRAIEALGYLSEAIASRKVSPDMATQVREYVVSLRTMPEREFTARQR